MQVMINMATYCRKYNKKVNHCFSCHQEKQNNYHNSRNVLVVPTAQYLYNRM